jgi:hypothetical protein
VWRVAGVLLLAVVVLAVWQPSILERLSSTIYQPGAAITPTRATATAEPARLPAQATATASPVLADPTPEVVSVTSVKSKPVQDSQSGKAVSPIVELPRLLLAPSIGVNSAFEYVGLASDGAMDVPKDPSKVAWYQLGPRPGERGNAVVAGHVDWGGKLAVFWRLKELRPGDDLEIVAADDKHFPFVVRWQRWYDAGSPLVNEVFGQSTDTELTLITCGGDFDKSSRQYLSRLVVRASLR